MFLLVLIRSKISTQSHKSKVVIDSCNHCPLECIAGWWVMYKRN